VFGELGVREVTMLAVADRAQARDAGFVAQIKRATTVVLAGDDPLSLTSQLGGSPLFRSVQEVYAPGGTVIGVGAGTITLSETALLPSADGAHTAAPRLLPGLALVDGMLVATHADKPACLARLRRAVVASTYGLGLGLAPDTAVFVQGRQLSIFGSGTVWVVDRRLAAGEHQLLALTAGDRYDLASHTPYRVRQVGQQ
jgi:cyanophycinase